MSAVTYDRPRQITKAQLRKMQAGKRRARREKPKRLKMVEQAITDLGREIDALTKKGEPVPYALRAELRDLGQKRLSLKWGE